MYQINSDLDYALELELKHVKFHGVNSRDGNIEENMETLRYIYIYMRVHIGLAWLGLV